MDTISNENLSNLVTHAETYAILTHKRPDGDAISSSLALFWYLIDIGKKSSNIDVIIPEFMEDFSFIWGVEHLKKHPTKDTYDLIIVVDCANSTLLEGLDILQRSKKVICFDHHEESSINSIYQKIDTSSPSCTCLIYEAFPCKNKDFLNCIATGLISDTGNFTLNTSQRGKNILAELACAGVDINYITEKLSSKNDRTIELVQLVKSRGHIVSTHEEEIFCSYLLQNDLLPAEKNLNAVNHKAIIAEIQKLVSYSSLILLIENDCGELKGSLRTSNPALDLNEICSRLIAKGKCTKGGGHSYSSGCTIPVTSYKNINTVFVWIVLEIANYLSQK